MLREALEIIRLLWSGGHLRLEDARVFGPRTVEGSGRAAEPCELRRRHPFDHCRSPARAVRCGPEVERHVEIAQPFVDACYDDLALINAGADISGFTKVLGLALRALLTGAGGRRPEE
jgi:hypothetical protein